MDPTKRAITKNNKPCWELDFGVDATGEKRRRFFRTEDKADAEIDRCKKLDKSHGDYWARMTPVERANTVSILQDIKSKKLTLSRVWVEHQTWSKDADKQGSSTPMPYVDVVAEFKRRKLAAGKTQRYVDELGDLFMKFGKGREKQNIHEIPASELEKWIDAQKTWGLSSKQTNILRFSSLWSVALDKGWATYPSARRVRSYCLTW